MKANTASSAGIPLVCELLFDKHVDDALAAQLDYVISPRPTSASSDTAYGIFLSSVWKDAKYSLTSR